MNHKYTEEHLAFIEMHSMGNNDKDLTKLFNEHFKLNYTKSSISFFRYAHGFLSGITNHGKRLSPATEFKKGHSSWNKGTKGLTSANRTSFKPGHKPHNTHPVGTVMMREDGYIYVKVEETKPSRFGWKALHKQNWEKIHGPIPKGHKLLFLDGDHTNCDPSNLLLITSGQIATINKFKLTFNDAELTRIGANIADLISKTYQMKNEVKS